MKHYFSFLVLSLFVFLSLVCPSPVMAECTNTKTIQCEDYVSYNTKPGGSNDSRPSQLQTNDYTGYGTPAGGAFADYKESAGEMWIPVTLPAGTFTFTIRYAKGTNVWFNLYSVSSGSKIHYKEIYGKGDSFGTSNSDSYELSAGDYVIGLYSAGTYTAFDQVVITATSDVFCESSCTAPDHVDITPTGGGDNYGWRYSLGETLRLTATPYPSEGTGSPITSGITGYQWQKYVGSEWQNLTDGGDVSGATSANLQISNLTNSNGGSYRCQISTGATCTTESAGYFVRIFTLYGGYEGGSYSHQPIVWNSEKEGTVTINLNASSTYKFKFTDNDGKWYGNGGTIASDLAPTWEWGFGSTAGDATLTTGGYGTGEYVLTVDITHYDDGGSKYVNLRSVVYPKKTTYLQLCSDWKAATAKYAIYYWKGGTNGWTDFMTSDACDGDFLSADIPVWATNCSFGRFNSSKESTGNWDDKWNQTGDLTLSSGNDYYYNLSKGGDEKYYGTWGTFSPSTYTISFAGNDNTGGSMSNVTAIPCGEDRTLVANGFTKTGHSFTNWIADADVKINGETVTAGSSISNEATIQDITQNITLTAQWAPKTTSVTLDANTANHGATGSSVTATWGTALPDFVAATGVSGYALTGYFTAPTGGTKIINADGTLAANTTYTTADSKWNSELSALTLYPQYESSISPKTVPCSLGFYYTEVGGAQGKDILDSDFRYSCNKDYAKNDQHNPYQEVCFSGSGHTLTSRMDVVFPQTGTYKFTFPLYIKERVSNLDAPRVTVNGSQSDAAYISTDGEENQNFTTTLTVTAGTYTVSVWIGNTNEKVFFSTMEIDSYQCRNIITTGAVGLFDSNQGSGGGASYTCSSVADPECHFDHNVFCFEYSSMGGNSSNYYGCRLTSGPAYTPNAAATGFAFWYRTESSSDPVYMEFAGKVYKLAATNRAWYYTYVASSRAGEKSGDFDIWINGEKDGFSTTQSSGKIYLSELQATNVTSADPIAPATTHTITVASNNNTYGTVSSTPASGSSVTDCASITVTATPESGCSFVEWKKGGTQVSTEAAYTFTMSDLNDGSDLTLTAYFQQDELSISSLPWAGDQDLTGQTVVSAEAISSCFDSEITFTFTGTGTVNYYDNNNRSSSLGTVTSGMAITLTDNLRAHGIYIRCTSDDANLTEVSKTTIGSVYEIWSGTRSSLGNVAVGDWNQQVVLGPEHFQTAEEGDVLRVITSGEGGDAQGALQYILTDGDSHTYKGLDNSTSGGLRDWSLSSEEKDRHYFEITINETHLANLQHHGVIVKGRNYTIQSVELRASCSNQTMRTSAPDVTIHGADGSIDIMTNKLEFVGEGFDLGSWEYKLELDERCFNNVTVGSIINFYMKVEDGATLSFRCNVDSVHAKSYETPPLCPSYGDISFDRTIDDLYGDEPALIGRIEGYKVLYLLVDADMRRRLQETGMILCGKGTLIKVVEGVPETVVVNPEDKTKVPTVVNNLTIHQGGQVINTEDIEVLGKITYIRPATDDGTEGKLGNQLDQWYTFALPFEVSDVEVRDETDGAWYDINAVYYLSETTDQKTSVPDGAGHYYLQYLKAENETVPGAFAARWQYITPAHSEYIHADTYNEDRYGYPKKDEAYIILFDRVQPIGDYFETNTQVRYVGGPQTIEGVAKQWKIESDGEQYWMYANNTLHSFTLTDAYILNEAGTYFELQTAPTIRPFECYVQATESLKTRYAAIPMRGFHIDNTPTGAESIQGSAIRAEKILRNGQLIIIRNGVEYDATGVVIR